MNPVTQDKNAGTSKQSGGDAGRAVADGDPRLVARRRAFLLLEAHRESLAARLQRRVRIRRRYEDLCLVKMVTRLQRDYLSQPRPPESRPSRDGDVVEYGIAEWARPWGPTFLLQFQADLNVFDLKLKSSRRWMSAATQRQRRHGRRTASRRSWPGWPAS